MRCLGLGEKQPQGSTALVLITIGDFLNEDLKDKILNIMSLQSYNHHLDSILGRSSNQVDPNKYLIPKSISNETTLPYDVDRPEVLREKLNELLQTSYDRLIKESLMCKTLSIRLRIY